MRLGILSIAGEPIAAQLWIVHGRWAGVLKLAYRETHKALAPGNVLTGLMIRHLLEHDAIAEIDFGRGDDDYKQQWARERRQRVGLLVQWRRGIQPGLWRYRGTLLAGSGRLSRIPGRNRDSRNKSFLLLFLEKEVLPCLS